MRKPDDQRLVMQLIQAYEEEDRLYAGIQEAVVEQFNLLRNGRDPHRLAELVDVQRRLSEHIGKIESGITPLREHWERVRDGVRANDVRQLGRMLDELLERLVERIHAIVEVEKDNTRALLAAGD